MTGVAPPSVLQRADRASLAYHALAGRGPTVVWLGGFRSDMGGTKAEALADWAIAQGRAFLRFDYFGHGESSGDFVKSGCITRKRFGLTPVDFGPSEYVNRKVGRGHP